MFKRVMLTGALLVAVALAGSWIVGQADSPAVAVAEEMEPKLDPTQTITVVGQGSVSVAPDIARVSIGVETSAESVSDAVGENAEQMEAIMQVLEELGIAEKDIQTMNYSISIDRYPETLPRLVEGEQEPAQPQYRVSNMVNVTIRDLDSVSDVLDGVIEAGANNIWGVSFEVDDTDAAQAEAREKAVANALARAEALADLTSVELGPVMAVSEIVGGGVVPMAMSVERAVGGGGSPISPGEVEVSYQVQVSYFITR